MTVNKKRIPFASVHLPLEIGEEVKKTVNSGWLSGGRKVVEFEEAFKKKFGVRYALAVNTCTSALRLGYAIAGVGPGDEVITTPFTMLATNSTILEQFGKIVFADIKYETGNINPYDIVHRITNRTKAITCVDVAGYPNNLYVLKKICKENNLMLIEDAAHSLGSKYMGRYIGQGVDFCCFSFYATKHITTGDGGMVTTDNDGRAKEVELRRWYGIDKEKRFANPYLGYAAFDIDRLGYKYNMNEIAGAMGLVQMKYIDKIIKRRRQIAKIYREELEGVEGLELFEEKKGYESSYWLFPIHVQKRLKFGKKMYDKGIECSLAYARNDNYTVCGGKRKDLPEMDRFEKTYIYIPMHSELTDKEVDYIVKTIKKGW